MIEGPPSPPKPERYGLLVEFLIGLAAALIFAAGVLAIALAFQ